MRMSLSQFNAMCSVMRSHGLSVNNLKNEITTLQDGYVSMPISLAHLLLVCFIRA